MNKIVRNAILAASLLAGFAATSYAGLCTAPPPTPHGLRK
ncbi:hypothetical protein GCM10011586_18780 [Silvibacterium dinghuense]|nr:hypothetical protein GCM10011586_18780 [Silvibacterium dinghuense]